MVGATLSMVIDFVPAVCTPSSSSTVRMIVTAVPAALPSAYPWVRVPPAVNRSAYSTGVYLSLIHI